MPHAAMIVHLSGINSLQSIMAGVACLAWYLHHIYTSHETKDTATGVSAVLGPIDFETILQAVLMGEQKHSNH